ncbi:unnamed protein product [Discula destructiva]
MEAHDAAVTLIATRMRSFHEKKIPYRNYHGSSLSTRPSDRTRDNIVDTSSLRHVLSIDKKHKTALVEPNVAMDVLVEATMQQGLVPQIVMEFPSITVGGGFSGSAGESSSFRFGLFEATINCIEIVLATGEVTKASRTDKQDLFWGAASAFGTLGVVTVLEVQLMDARKYVALTYHYSEGFPKILAKINEEISKEANDYVDAIMFTRDTAVTCSGRLVDNLPSDQAPRTFTRRKDPWFYLRAHQIHSKMAKSSDAPVITDYIPLVDYLFRYDRGGFWTGRETFKYFKVPFNRITRYVLDPLLHTRVINTAQAKTDFANYYMVQDCGIPLDKCQDFNTWLDTHVDIYPIWLCPLRVRRPTPDAAHGIHAAMGRADHPDLLNFGVWGFNSWDLQEAIGKNRALETQVRRLGGWKTLYAHAYYTEDEFWELYDRDSYSAVRDKYGAAHLPSVYDKVRVKIDVETGKRSRLRSMWPVEGLVGLYYAFKGGDVLLKK